MATVADEMTGNAPAAGLAGGSARPVVAGSYEIELDEPLGSGGMAVVYHGRDLRTRREVALKTLRPEYRADPDARAKFRREARTMAFLAHRNVIRVYDLYEDDQAPWVVLEFAPGRSLRDEIAARGPLPLAEASHLLDQMAAALDHLHDRGLVHLDVKPQNLIVTPERTVKLIDFGLAQRAGTRQETIAGSAFGTAAYLSPEQACGEPVDAASDVYALGCVAYEMVTGQPPFEGDPAAANKDDVIRAHVHDDPAPPSAVRPLPDWIDDAVMPALAKKPAERYRDCATLARAFAAGLAEDEPEGIVSLQPAATAKVWTPPVREPRVESPNVYEFGPEPVGPGVGERVFGAVYRTGGKAARHTSGVQRLLWRAALALLIGNLLLAALLYANDGEIPGVIAKERGLHAGVAARVTTADLRLRDRPGRQSDVLGVLGNDQRITIMGAATTEAGETWWPVRATVDGVTSEGYVAGGWIEPAEAPKDVWLQRAEDEVASWPGKLADRVTGSN